MRARPLAAAALLAALAAGAPAARATAPEGPAAASLPVRAALDIALVADAANPAAPRMGDRLAFHATIRNGSAAPAEGVVAWMTILRVDAGHEEAIDLEDWSANRALTIPAVAPGGEARSDWTLRLISPGTYRVLVSAAARGAPVPAVGTAAAFSVAPRPVVESARVLPVALGIPFVLGGLIALRARAGRRTEVEPA